jgi:diguanylate cyclase (GGDEF)-like protein
MKNCPENADLRASIPGRGTPLAVFSLTSDTIFEAKEGIELIRGVWGGEPAVAIVDLQHDPYEQDLKSLHDISFDLSLFESVDDLCREAVRLGRERLDFDRIGVWLIDPNDHAWKLGSWGTDPEGKLRDERGLRFPCVSGGQPSEFSEGKIPLLAYEDKVLIDVDETEVGRGSKLIAPLWDGHNLVGEIGVDDLLRHRGFSPEKREIFIIFARVVGHLISLKRAESELRHLASIDSLTGTVNRRTALIILEKCLAQCRRSGSALTLCLADLDGLKMVNDAYGHAAGDEYIRRASATLVGAVRSSDTVGRIGGDEFLIIFPDCRVDIVAAVMERVNVELAASAKGRNYRPRLSWGTSSPGEIERLVQGEDSTPHRSVDMLLELADQRMYENKRTKGTVRPRPAAPAKPSSPSKLESVPKPSCDGVS